MATIKGLGARVYKERMRLGMSQAQLARKLGCTRPCVSEVEAGLRGFPLPRFVKLCRALRVSADYLLGIKR